MRNPNRGVIVVVGHDSQAIKPSSTWYQLALFPSLARTATLDKNVEEEGPEFMEDMYGQRTLLEECQAWRTGRRQEGAGFRSSSRGVILAM